MGYSAEQAKLNRKKKKIKWLVCGVAALLLMVLCVISAHVPADSWKYYFRLPSVEPRGEGEMRLHFLSVGEGDCTLVELPDGKTMLVDGGTVTEQSVSNILRYLNALKIDTIDYLVITNVRNYRCGGLDKIVRFKKIGQAILPSAEGDAGTEYAEAYTALTKEETPIVQAERYLTLSDEQCGYTLAFLAPLSTVTEEEFESQPDGNSAVIWLSYQSVSALLGGDIGDAELSQLVSSDSLGFFDSMGVTLAQTDILKVSKHGADGTLTATLLDYLNAETAVISCGENKSNPTETTLDTLMRSGLDIYRTDESGNIVVTIDGGKYTVAAVRNQ